MIDTSLQRNVLNGFYRGQVLKHCSAGKCKIWIPSVYPEEAVINPDILPDAEQASPLFGGSSNGSGIFTYPRINAQVWCFFQNGDQNLPVYFAASNGGPDGVQQYTAIGPDGKYEEQGKEHDHIIDVTDKISDAEIHRINVSRGQVSFYEDGSIEVTTQKTNKLGAPYNVNLPYSESNHMLHTLSTVIFPGAVTDVSYVSDSPYSYHTKNILSGLDNAAFGISCNINASPGSVYSEITGKLGACCIKGYKTQCRPVYAAQGAGEKNKSKTKPIYIEQKEPIELTSYSNGVTTTEEHYIAVDSHWEMFKTIYEDENQEVDNSVVYEITKKNEVEKARIDGITYRVGDKIRISKKEVVRNISKALVYKIEEKEPQCMVFIAAEDCSIDKWNYILSSGYDVYLCSPSQFNNPVLYFDKKLDDTYPQQCPSKKWPGIINPKVAQYKASIILTEDRRKFSQMRFNKNGTIEMALSDSYDESYVSSTMSATGDYEYHAFKQDYEDWNKTHNYYYGAAVQAKISGYNAMNMGFANDDDKHNGYISVWNYQVRKCNPKSSAKWWYYNDFLEWDQHNGLCCFNNNLSISDKPEYWQKHIDEAHFWPRWKHDTPIEPNLQEHISCGYYMNVNEGVAAWNFGHLSNYAEMSFAKMSADYFGDISVEATKEFDLLLTDVRHADYPKHCGEQLNTWPPAPSDVNKRCDPISNSHTSLPGTEPFIHNEWTHLKFTREGELSVHGTKFIELSCSDPYKQYDFMHLLLSNDGTLSVNNSRSIDLLTMAPPAGRDGQESTIKKECCDWPVEELKSSMGQLHDNNRGDNTDWPFSKVSMRNDGDIDIDVYHQVDIFAAPNQYYGKKWSSLTKTVHQMGGKGTDPCKPPRAHLRLTAGDGSVANTTDQTDPNHKVKSGDSGTITGDCCNKIHFFSTNGSIQIENQNAIKPTNIVINNAPIGSDKTLQGNGIKTAGISIRNDTFASSEDNGDPQMIQPGGIEVRNVLTSEVGIVISNDDITNGGVYIQNKAKSDGIFIHNEGNSNTGIELKNTGNTKGIFLHNESSANEGIEIDNKTRGKIKIHTASGDITIATDNGNIEITCSRTVTITAPNRVEIVSPTVHMTGNLNVDGNIVAGGKVTDCGCTLATHKHPFICPSHGSGGISQAGV